MAGQTVVHTLRVQSEERGGAQAAAALHKVAGEAMAASAAVEKYATKAQASLGAASAGLTKTQDQLGKSMLSSTKSIDRLQRSIDPVFRSLSQLENAQRRVNAAIDAGSITADRGATIIAGFRDRYDKTVASMGGMAKAAAGANDNLKLTGSQVQNLGFQLNDVATMLASGASPFQVMATQSGQVIQALQMGPGGLGGSLRAIGAQVMGLAARITPMGLAISGGLAAAGAGMAYFTLRSSDAEKSLSANEAAAKSYTDALKDLRTAAGDAGKAAATIFDRETQLSPVAARAQLAKAVADQQAAIAAAAASAQSRTGPDAAGTLGGLASAFRLIGDSDFRRVFGELNGLTSALTRGEATATEYRDALAEIQLDPNTPDDLKEIADLLLEDAASAVEAEARIKALTGAIAEMGYAAAKAKVGDILGDLDAMGPQLSQAQQIIRMNNQALLELGNLDPSKNSPRAIEGMARWIQDAAGAAYDELSRSASEAAADAEAALADIDAAPLTRQINEITRSYQRQIEEAERANGAAETTAALQRQMQAEIAAATREAARAEEARRAGYQLDLAAVTAHTDAQRAGIEAQRAYNAAIAEGLGAIEATARAEEARTLVMARASEEARRSAADRMAGYQGQVERAQFELTLIGKSAAEVVRLTTEFQALQAAKQATRESGGVTAEETQAIRDQAAAVGGLTQRLAEAKLQQDILFERSLIGLSDQERAIRQKLNSSGIDPASASGEYLAGQQRLNDEMEKSRDLAEDFTRSLIDGLSSGEGALDSIINTFAKLGQQMASAGLEKLFNGIMGGGQAGQSATTTLGGAITSIGQALAQPSRSFAVPVGSVQRAPLADMPSRTGDYMSVAKRFNSQVDNRLMTILNTASQNFDLKVEAVSGFRPGDPRYHGKGLATDVQIYGQGGNPLANYQDGSTFRVYERFAQEAKKVQQQIFPELDKLFRWGGYFSGAKGKYGALDSMHFDLAGAGMGGGSFAGGLTPAQQRLFPNAQSVGMGAGGSGALAPAVSAGIISANKQIVSGAVPGLDAWAGMRSITPGAVAPTVAGQQQQGGFANFMQSPAGQTGMAAIGSFAAGFQSGSPVGGGIQGALGGFMAGGPIGAIIGGAAGLLGGLFGKSKQKKEQEKQERRQAEQAWEQNYSQFLEISDTVTRTEVGPINKQLREIESALKQYQSLAKKTKDGGNVDEVQNAMNAALNYADFLRDNLRRALPKMTEDLGEGLGLDTVFNKARNAVMDMSDQYRGFIDDVREAYKVPVEKKDAILAEHAAAVAAINAEQAAAKQGAHGASIQQQAQTVNGAFWDTFHAGKKVDNPLANLALIGDDDRFAALSTAALGKISERMAEADLTRDEALAEYYAEVADLQAKYDAAVSAANNAAIEGLLKIVSGDVKEQSDIEKALDESRGAAQGLATALVDLGLTAEVAGERIEVALQARLANLVEDFTRGLQDEIDSLDGKGYFADFRALFEDVETLAADAALIGVDGAIVDEFFTKQAQAIVDAAELTGDEFDELIDKFPELADVVEEFAGSLEAAAERIKGFKDRYLEAIGDTSTLDGALASFDRAAEREREEERRAGGQGLDTLNAALASERVNLIRDKIRERYEAERAEIEDTISTLEGLSGQWRDFLSDIRLNDDRSPLSPKEQFLEAQATFREISALAASGDEEAQARLADVSSDYLDEARSYYASSEDYFNAFYEVQNAIEGSANVAEQELASSRAQLDTLKSQLTALGVINESVLDLGAAIAQLEGAMRDAATAAQIAQLPLPGGGGGVYNGGTPVSGSNTSIPDTGVGGISRENLETWGFIETQFQAILGRGADAGALNYWTDVRNTGATAEDIIAAIKNSPEAQARGYAAGGLVAGPGTGTSDSIAARLSAGEFVMPASRVTARTLPMLETMRAGRVANDDPTVTEIRALRSEVSRLGAIIAGSDEATREILRDGNRSSAMVAKSAERKAAA